MHSNIMSNPWPGDFFASNEEAAQEQPTAQDQPQERYVVDPAQFPSSSVPVPVDFNSPANRAFAAGPSSDYHRNAPPQLSPPPRFQGPTYPFTFPPTLPFPQPTSSTLPPVLPRSDGPPSFYHGGLPSTLEVRPQFIDRAGLPFGSPSSLKPKAGGSSHGAPSSAVLMPSVHRQFGRDLKSDFPHAPQPPQLHAQTVATSSRSIVVEEDDWPPDNRVGRQRVMTTCPQCGHSNHIRRKICQKCQAPKPPPAKRKRRRKRKSLGTLRRGVPGHPGNRMPMPMHLGGREGDPRFLEHAESAFQQQTAMRLGPPQPSAFVEAQNPPSHIGETVLGIPGGRQIMDPQSTPVPPLPQPGAFSASLSGADSGQVTRNLPRER